MLLIKIITIYYVYIHICDNVLATRLLVDNDYLLSSGNNIYYFDELSCYLRFVCKYQNKH